MLICYAVKYILGNPPWISIIGKHGSHIYDDETLLVLQNKLGINSYMPNTFEAFCLKATQLQSSRGMISMIVPDRITANENYSNARMALLKSGLSRIDFKVPFPDVIVDTVVFLCKGQQQADIVDVGRYNNIFTSVPIDKIEKTEDRVIPFIEHPYVAEVWEAIELGSESVLADWFRTTSGFGGRSEEISEERLTQQQIPIRKGADIGQFRLLPVKYFDFSPRNITGRTTNRAVLGSVPKVLLRKTGDTLIAAYDESGCFPEQSLYFLYDAKDISMYWGVLALLNSSLYTFLYRTRFVTNLDTTPQLK